MSDMVLLSDPEIVALPVRECGEPLIDVRTVAALRVDDRLADELGYHAMLRQSVVDRLVTAQTLLSPDLRLLLVEGYRPLELQARYFEAHVQRLRARGEDEDSLRRMASRYISPPEVAPHVAGAAADVTLCTVHGAELWMGTELNDTSSELCHTWHPDVAPLARRNRQLLSAALTAAGLVNYPSEWWHWSYGDRYWAYQTGVASSIYGPAHP